MTRVTTVPTTSMPFGDAYSITFCVGNTASTGGICRNRFVVADQASNAGNHRPVKYPAAAENAKKIIGLMGGYRVQAPVTNAGSISQGTAADPYAIGENVAVTVRGSDLVEAAIAAGEVGAIAYGDLIVTDNAGRAVKYDTQTVTPSMSATWANTAIGTTISGATATIGDAAIGAAVSGATATIGDAALGTIISGATATLTADHPTAAEIKAFLTEVLPAYNAAEAIKTKAFLSEVLPRYNALEAVKTKAFLTEILPVYAGKIATDGKAYLAEYIADYANAGNAGLEAVIGIALGAPDADKLVPFMFIGRA